MDRVPEIRDLPGCKTSFNVTESIKFKGVTFKYPLATEKAKNVLERVDF